MLSRNKRLSILTSYFCSWETIDFFLADRVDLESPCPPVAGVDEAGVLPETVEVVVAAVELVAGVAEVVEEVTEAGVEGGLDVGSTSVEAPLLLRREIISYGVPVRDAVPPPLPLPRTRLPPGGRPGRLFPSREVK